MRTFTLLLFVFIFLLAVAEPADAAVINDAGAAELKTQVEENLQWRLDVSKSLGRGLTMGGALQVTPKDAFYEVKLPALSMTFGPQGKTQGGKLDIGTVILNAAPGRSGEWLISAALPSTMTLYDETGAPVAEIGIGEQGFAGAWWPESGVVSKFDAFYDNILFKLIGAATPEAVVTIASVRGMLNLKDNGDGTWSGPGTFDISDMALNTRGENTVQALVKKLRVSSVYDRLDMSQEIATRKKLHAAYQGGKMPTAEELKTIFIGDLVKMQSLVDGMSNTVDISEVSIVQKSAQPDAKPMSLTLGMASFQGSLQGARQEKARISLKNSFNNLKMSFVPVDVAGLVPHAMSLEITTDNLPLKQIMAAFHTALQETLQQSPAGRQSVQTALSSLPGMLAASGTTVTVQNSFIRSLDLDATLAGKIDANAAAAMGAAGTITVSIKGLEEAIKTLQEQVAKPGADPKLTGYINGLMVMQMMGQLETGADGKTSRAYHFDLTPAGSMTLNGVDVRALGGGMGMKKQAAPPVPPVVPAP